MVRATSVMTALLDLRLGMGRQHKFLPVVLGLTSLVIQASNGVSPGSVLLDKSVFSDTPSFLNNSEFAVVTSVGQTAYLYCGVERLGDRRVSWIRSRDLTILTIGLDRYTSDQRFTAIHSKANNNWGLKILSPRSEDSGLYECQVSYHDDVEKKLKQPFNLTVLESKARIVGSPDLYMKEGSAVELECVVENVPAPPAYIYWYKQDQVISYSTRPELSLKLDKRNNTIASILTIKSARVSDSGNYTCAPANALTDSVFLNVVKGEKPEGLREISNSAVSARTPFGKRIPGSALIALTIAAAHLAVQLKPH